MAKMKKDKKSWTEDEEDQSHLLERRQKTSQEGFASKLETE